MIKFLKKETQKKLWNKSLEKNSRISRNSWNGWNSLEKFKNEVLRKIPENSSWSFVIYFCGGHKRNTGVFPGEIPGQPSGKITWMISGKLILRIKFLENPERNTQKIFERYLKRNYWRNHWKKLSRNDEISLTCHPLYCKNWNLKVLRIIFSFIKTSCQNFKSVIWFELLALKLLLYECIDHFLRSLRKLNLFCPINFQMRGDIEILSKWTFRDEHHQILLE